MTRTRPSMLSRAVLWTPWGQLVDLKPSSQLRGVERGVDKIGGTTRRERSYVRRVALAGTRCPHGASTDPFGDGERNLTVVPAVADERRSPTGSAATRNHEGAGTELEARHPPLTQGDDRRQPATTATSSSVVTSGWRRTVTGCLPTVLIWPGTSTARRSRAGPPAARTASTTSADGDRAEQPARVARGLRLDGDGEAAQLGGDLAGVPEVADLAGLAGPTDRVDLLLRAAGGHDGQPARKQVVAAVAVLDLDDVAGRAEIGHVTGEDELHDVPSAQRAVEV